MASTDERFTKAAQRMGHDFSGPIKVGGHYAPVVEHGGLCYISGQVPRVGDEIVIMGRVGQDVSLARAQAAAQVSVMRCLALLAQQWGSLDRVGRILRLTVYVQCAENFTQLSEVSDGASDLLEEILGESAVHSRTSVGVYALPKNAAVEIDMIAAVAD
jgi:enamine deaminase RidA (YjgF/YER057c/UK114 family)